MSRKTCISLSESVSAPGTKLERERSIFSASINPREGEINLASGLGIPDRIDLSIVLSGHDHVYERIVAEGTTYVVDGSGGKDLYGFDDPVAGSRTRFDDDFGALFLTASDRTLAGEFWSAGGVRIDRFVLRD